jgi:cytochrome c biogenesis protein CcmG/thiol:disulfide interchange protein DsbE
VSVAAITYPRYKRVTAAIILVLAGLWVAYLLLWPSQSKAPGTGIPVGQAAPDFTLETLDGKTLKLSDLKGKPVMLNFFTSWCSACREEMPALEEVYKEYQAQGFVIVAVNLAESDVAVRAFQQKLGLTFPIVMDRDQRVSRVYDIVPLPTSYFVDRNGVVRAKWTGALTKQQLKALLQQIL